MARKTRKLNDYDERDAYEDEEYEDEYDDEEYDDEYDDDYDDYDDRRSRRNPLKGVVVALVILVLLMGAIIGLLYMRLQSAEKRTDELTGSLNAARNEINTLLQERTATPEPVIVTPEPAATPVPKETATPEPIVTPAPTAEPTPEPTATPVPLLKDTITDEMLNGVARPDEASWLEKPQNAEVIPFMYALHWGPGMGWAENMALNQGDKVEIVAKQNGWVLLRIGGDKFGWGAGTLVKETEG